LVRLGRAAGNGRGSWRLAAGLHRASLCASPVRAKPPEPARRLHSHCRRRGGAGMSNPILLVAAREFRQIAATRSFWITLLILPFALAIGPLASHFMEKPHTETVMLIDRSGQAVPAIAERIELEHQRQVLQSLSRYSESHD